MRFGVLLEMEPHASSYQVLAQITAVIGVDLCAGVIQVVVLDEGASLLCPIIVCSGNYLPGQIGMIVSSGRAECSMRCFDIEPSRFGIINADSRARVRLEPSKGKSEQGVPLKALVLMKLLLVLPRVTTPSIFKVVSAPPRNPL